MKVILILKLLDDVLHNEGIIRVIVNTYNNRASLRIQKKKKQSDSDDDENASDEDSMEISTGDSTATTTTKKNALSPELQM
jgi:hypothetical protein